MNNYNQETIFHLPGIFTHYPLYNKLLEEIELNPNILKENVKIGSIFGAPSALWNGGRKIDTEKLKNFEFLANVKKTMEKYNIPLRFTFTNCLIEEKHLDDVYCNALLEFFNNGNNEIICNSELLENYIRNKYKNNYRYISSTTKRFQNDQQQLDEIDNKNYYLTVIDYDYNTRFDVLDKIINKDKCELLCNSVCMPKCPHRTNHFEMISKLQLNPNQINLDEPCIYESRSFYEIKNEHNCNFISFEDINNIYLPKGFKHFKLEGRTSYPSELIEVLIYYLIKDEYSLEIRQKLHALIV